MVERSINLQDAKVLLSTFPNLKSVNFGTGESILNGEFEKIVNYFYNNNIKLAITSNGLSIITISEEVLKKFKDVDISLDFPSAKFHNKWRGKSDLFEWAIKAIERCKKFKINISIASVLMANNYQYFGEFRKILDKYNIHLRINVYKAVNNSCFSPSYDEFWQAIKIISENYELVSCSEPILSVVTEKVEHGSPCGNSARVHPDGSISSCVYIKDGKSIDQFNEEKKIVPEFCENCEYRERCVGGCYGRRLADGRAILPDMYCPIYNNKDIPNIKFNKAKNCDNLIHSDYLCTIILK